MLLCRRKTLLFLLALFAAVVFQGCAHGDKRVNIVYQPVAKARGGSGIVYLVQGVKQPPAQAPAVQWVLGDVTNGDREILGKVRTDIPPAGLVLDALNEELRNAGYRTMTLDVMPAGVDKGIVLTDAILRLDDVHSAFSDEANCLLKVGLQQWRGGAATRNLEYQAEYSDTAVTGRDRLPSKVLQKTLQILMKRAIPEVVRVMEGGSATPRP
jgi:hypothetical protein